MDIKTTVFHSLKKHKPKGEAILAVFSRQKSLSFLTLALLLIAIPLTVVQSLHIQDNRQRAAGEADPACLAQCDSTYGNKNNEPICDTQKIAICQGRTINEGCKLIMNNKYVACGGGTACQQRAQQEEQQCEQKCTTDNCTAPVACDGTCQSCKTQCTATAPVSQGSTQTGSQDNTQCRKLGGTNAVCAKSPPYDPTNEISYDEISFGCYDGNISLGKCYHETDSAFGKFYVSCVNTASTKTPYNPITTNDVCRKEWADKSTPQSPPTSTTMYQACYNTCIKQEDAETCRKSCISPCEQNGNVCINPDAGAGISQCENAGYKAGTGSCTGSPSGGSICCAKTLTAPASPPATLPKPNEANCVTPKAGEGTINVRSSAITTASKIGEIKQGEKAYKTGLQPDKINGNLTWTHVQINSGLLGWTVSNYLKSCTESTSQVPATAPRTPPVVAKPGVTGTVSADPNGSCPAGFVQAGSTKGVCAPITNGGGNGSPRTSSPSANNGPIITSSPAKQITCSDNPVQAPVGKIWRAYCSNKCINSSDCKSLPDWPTDPASSQCYPFTNGSYCIQLQYNNIAGVCRDNPVAPPAGLQWKSACGGQVCTKNSDCPTTPGLNNSNWCYGFDDGARCLQLQVAGTQSSAAPNPATPTPTQTVAKDIKQPPTNPFISAWDSVVAFFKKLF